MKREQFLKWASFAIALIMAAYTTIRGLRAESIQVPSLTYIVSSMFICTALLISGGGR